MKALQPIFDLFLFHKMKMLATLGLTLVFVVLIFPFSDLSGWMTAKISQMTGGNLYVQFDDLNLKLLPSPAISLEQVMIESGSMPAIKADRISASPWLLGAISARLGVSVDADGVFGGVIAADYREGEKLKLGHREQNVAIEAQGLKLIAVSEFLRQGGMADIALQGTMALENTQVTFDPLFDKQPSGNLGVSIAGFALPGQTFNVNFNGAMMPVPLPELRLGQTKLDAKMNEGQLEIESFTFGGGAEPLNGKASGRIGLSFRRDAAGIRPVMGDYNLTIDLSVKKEFLANNESSGIGVALGFLKQFRQDTPQGARFAFKIQGSPAMGGLPNLSAIQ